MNLLKENQLIGMYVKMELSYWKYNTTENKRKEVKIKNDCRLLYHGNRLHM